MLYLKEGKKIKTVEKSKEEEAEEGEEVASFIDSGEGSMEEEIKKQKENKWLKRRQRSR